MITQGEGTHPVLLLHGFLGSGRNLRGLASAWLAHDPNLQMIMPDHLGHGRSPPLAPNANLEQLAQALWDLMDELAITSALPLVGHSMGGRVALVARRLRPERVSSVHLLDISPGALIQPSATSAIVQILCDAPSRTDNRQQMRDILETAGIERPIAEWLLMNGSTNSNGFCWHIDREALRCMHNIHAQENLWPDIEPAKRTTLIKAANSEFIPDKDMTRLRSLGVRSIIIEDAGHFLHAERPDEVAQQLARYIAEI